MACEFLFNLADLPFSFGFSFLSIAMPLFQFSQHSTSALFIFLMKAVTASLNFLMLVNSVVNR